MDTGGKSVLFLAHRGEHEEIFRLPMNGGEPHPYEIKIVALVDASNASDAMAIDAQKESIAKPVLETVVMDVTAFEVSPDGKTCALLGADPVTPKEKKQQDARADAVLVDHDLHRTRLYLLSLEKGELTSVAVPPNVSSAAWSAQSENILVRSASPNNVGDLSPAASVWMVDIRNCQNPTKLIALRPTFQSATWSLDASAIYYVAQAAQDTPPGYRDLYGDSLKDQAIQNYNAHYVGTPERTPLVDGNGDVLVPVQDGVRRSLARLDTKNSKLIARQFDQTVVTDFDSNAEHTGWVYLGQSSTQPNTLYYAERLGASARILPTPPLVPASWLEPWHGFDARQCIVTFFQSQFENKASADTTTPVSK